MLSILFHFFYHSKQERMQKTTHSGYHCCIRRRHRR